MTSRARRWAIRLCVLAGGAMLASWAASAPAADSATLTRKARKDVIEADIKAPKDPKAGSAALQRAVKNVDGIRLEPKVELPPPPPMPEIPVMPPVEPMSVQPLTPAGDKAASEKPLISDAVAERLKSLPADKVADPLGLADALYLGGRMTEAATFYEKVLAGSARPDSKAWALYQMANCRRTSDPAAAVAFYKRVGAEFPKSPWAGVAAVQQRLLEWYQTVGQDTGAETKKPAGAGPAAAPEAKKPVAEPPAVPEVKKPAAAPAAVPEAKKPSSGS